MSPSPAHPTHAWVLDLSERRRVTALALRLRGARNAGLAFLLPGLVVATHAYGPLILPFAAALLAGLVVVGISMRRTRHPEAPLLGALLWTQAMLCGMLAVAERYQLDALGLLILPAAAACILFPGRLAAGFVGWSVAVIVGTAFVLDPHRVLEAPPIVFLPVGVLLCVTLPAIMVRRLELASRDTAMVDSLTGALNRTALELRLAELGEQTTNGMELRVGALMIDLDRFKQINDEAGHAAGDQVLATTVSRIRATLGPLTPIYRAGGEEFVVLIAGANGDAVAQVGEQVRTAVRERAIVGRQVTVSVGAAAATLDAIAPRELLAAADEALYAAKRTGRDRVVRADQPVELAPDASGPSADMSEVTASAADADDRAALTVVASPTPASASVHREALAAPATSVGDDRSNWLVRGEFEREHIRSSARAMATTHHGALGMIGLALALSIPWMGWHLMVPAVLPVIGYHVIERRIRHLRRPEYALGAAWLAVQLAIFAGALLADPGEPYMLILFVPMMISVTAVFPTRGIVVASIISAVLASVGGIFARPDLVLATPGLLVPPLLVIAGFALMSSAAGRSAIEFSTQAVVDPLTGLLTRAALQSRLAELGKQAEIGATPVSLVAFDVDDFKTLNDTYGHATGDAILSAVGQATRSRLGALEWGFRLGGDEFLVVVPAGEEQARSLAATLRAALAAIDVDGRGVTGSFGVAASAPGEAFQFEHLSARADGALYEAKRAGRNCVAVAPPGDPAARPQLMPRVA